MRTSFGLIPNQQTPKMVGLLLNKLSAPSGEKCSHGSHNEGPLVLSFPWYLDFFLPRRYQGTLLATETACSEVACNFSRPLVRRFFWSSRASTSRGEAGKPGTWLEFRWRPLLNRPEKVTNSLNKHLEKKKEKKKKRKKEKKQFKHHPTERKDKLRLAKAMFNHHPRGEKCREPCWPVSVKCPNAIGLGDAYRDADNEPEGDALREFGSFIEPNSWWLAQNVFAK